MERLRGHRIIITGATGGIGEATARRVIEEGASVLLVDLYEEPLKALAEDLGERAAHFAADVSDPDQAAAYVGACVDHFGGVDALFANAGIEGKVTPLLQVDPAGMQRVLDVNLMGALYGIQRAAPVMLSSGGGSIVITSSVAGLVGSPGLGPYCASKHAVIGLMKTAAQELGPQGIRVNTVNPGPVDNRMMRSIEEQASPGAGDAVKEKFSAMVPLGRYATNEEVAAMAAFLLSDDSASCNGASYVVDGGLLSA